MEASVVATIGRDVDALSPGLIALRRELHQHPELAFEEVWTAATLAAQMRSLGLPVQEGIGGTGVLAVLEGARPGKTLLVRAGMDALPMAETTGRSYASRFPDKSHACGHDVHSAIVVGVAQLLSRRRDRIAGRVAFVFQPADEPMRGAKRMIEDGLLARVTPDMSLGVHVLPMLAVGQAVIQRGPLWASRDELTLTVDGEPGRLEFVRTAARITAALYDLVDTEGRSSEPVTFRVRSVDAGQNGPVWLGGSRGVPDHAVIGIDLALYDNALRSRLLTRIHEVSDAIVRAEGGTLQIEMDHALPALVNDDRVTGALERAAREVIGQAGIVGGWRNPFSDDFGLLLASAPGALLLLGTANPAKRITEIWHRPGFDVDEDALPLGVRLIVLAVLDLLRP